MEPIFANDDSLRDILEELKKREPIFHRRELGTTPADLENMTTADFWEVGASGRRYSREYVFAELKKRYARDSADVWETRDFQCRRLAEEVYLLTYTLLQGERTTRRTTIWQRTESGWKIVFHQGTVVEEA